jgi:diguanylate cyclase (GGDEF)-like protein/PAS domain S-box-containing protein
VRELGHRFGDAATVVPPTEHHGAGWAASDPVLRTDIHRSRQAAFGGEVHPEAAMFASRLARAVADATGPAGVVPAAGPDDERRPTLRDVVFGGGSTSATPDVVLPADPALVCDREERVVRLNGALLGLLGVEEQDATRLAGTRVRTLIRGPDADARLVRADGGLVPVYVVRWPLPGTDLTAVLLVELPAGQAPAPASDPAWVTELERLARVGTWTFELATATLHRSGTLEELYHSVGIDPDGGGSPPVEGDQIAALCRALRDGTPTGDHHVQLPLPGGGMLSCRAEAERTANGVPVRLIGVVHDVSPARIAGLRVERCAHRFADLMALAPGGVALLDPSGRVLDANPGMCALLDVSVDQLRGKPASALSAEELPEGGGPLPGWLRQVPPGARHGYRVESAALRRGDGTTVWCELAVSTTTADDGGWFWLVTCVDVSDRRRAAEVLRSAGIVDELTRLPNRAAGLALVDRLLAGPDRDRVAVVCGDLDDFARINSSLGHDAGDDLLLSLAGRLQRELPFGCTPARLGADEFVVICADHAEVGGPDMLARTVADLLRTTITVSGRPVQVTASVGLATPVPTGEVRAADLLRFAEAAMHDAKRRQARGGIGMATDGIVSSATKALELEAELRAAIAGDGLVLEYQPVVEPDGRVLKAEALVRWAHPERGLIPPGDFLPVAQRSGLLRELDLWVLRAATREAATWPQHAGRPAVAVNLAGLLPSDPGFCSAVNEAVADAGLGWDQLVFELVETSLVALPPHALAAMAELTERGVRFAVDDFGTGYSSLARLKKLPAQTVKVDRAFVTGIADDPADFAVARAVVDMARAMGRTTVAEGVETAEQFHVLRGIGVDAYQGWLFSRPMSAGALHQVLRKGRLATPASAGR